VLRLVEAQSASETVAELLAATPDVGRVPDSDWALLLLRGANARERIAARAGGLLSSGEAAKLLNITVPGVKQRVDRRKLLAVPLPGGQRGFPVNQFERDGVVRSGVAEVAHAGEGIDPWVLLSILTDEAPDGATLLERLDQGVARADVLNRVATYGEHGAA